jgi:hypothetical protein
MEHPPVTTETAAHAIIQEQTRNMDMPPASVIKKMLDAGRNAHKCKHSVCSQLWSIRNQLMSKYHTLSAECSFLAQIHPAISIWMRRFLPAFRANTSVR